MPQVFYLRRAPITIAGNLTENLQLPFHQLTVKTVDANGVVPDVKVGGGGFGYFSEDDPASELAPGVSAEEMDTSSTATTNAEGEATLPIADFYSATATATPPEETGLPAQPFSVSNVTQEGEERTVGYDYFATRLGRCCIRAS